MNPIEQALAIVKNHSIKIHAGRLEILMKSLTMDGTKLCAKELNGKGIYLNDKDQVYTHFNKIKKPGQKFDKHTLKIIWPAMAEYMDNGQWHKRLLSIQKAMNADDTICPTWKAGKNGSLYTSDPNIQGLCDKYLYPILCDHDHLRSVDYQSMFPGVAAWLFSCENLKADYEGNAIYDFDFDDMPDDMCRKKNKVVFLALMFGSGLPNLSRRGLYPMDTLKTMKREMEYTYPFLKTLDNEGRDRIRRTSSYLFNKKFVELATGEPPFHPILIRHDQIIYTNPALSDEYDFRIALGTKFELCGTVKTWEEIAQDL